MILHCQWREKLQFTGEVDGFKIDMDASPPLGTGGGPTPKQLLLAGICGCTAMDVAALMRKHKQPMTSFSIAAETASTEGTHPAIFKSVMLTFKISGEVDPAKALEAVELSQTQYCGVSAMVSKTVPISYRVEVNGKLIGEGRAEFKGLN